MPQEISNGQKLDDGILAYETYGQLNENRDNAILVFHALSGSQHAAGYRESVSRSVDPLWTDECKKGWWDGFIGKNKVIDTSRHFLICANYLGGCYGSTGPTSNKANSEDKYMSSFPWVTMEDLVRSQMKLIDSLQIKELHAVVGASLGGLLALTTMLLFPGRTMRLVSVASGLKLQPLQIIHNFEQVKAIKNDPLFLNGNYREDKPPLSGLELARMIGHKTYVSLETMTDRAKKNMVHVPLREGRTLHHDVKGRFGAGKVVLRAAPPGTGIIAGGPMRAVFETIGIQDIVAKSTGSANPHNMVKATFDALSNCVSPRSVAARRSKKVADIVARRGEQVVS